MKNAKKEKLWYNPDGRKSHAPFQLGVEAAGIGLDHLTAFREGRSLLDSYCRFYSQKG